MQIQRIEEAADRIAALVHAWLRHELGDHPRWASLSKFLEERFPRDLRNLGLYAWHVRAKHLGEEQGKRAAAEYVSRVSLYLVEQGYFHTLKEAWGLMTAAIQIGDPSAKPRERACQRLRRVVARRLGVPDSASPPPATGFLASPKKERIEFERRIRRRSVPVFFYALWTKPDAAFQKAHLGGVKVAGDGLVSYVLWRNRLPAAERRRWDRMLGRLDPGRPLEPQLTRLAASAETRLGPWSEPGLDMLFDLEYDKIAGPDAAQATRPFP